MEGNRRNPEPLRCEEGSRMEEYVLCIDIVGRGGVDYAETRMPKQLSERDAILYNF